MALTFPRWLTLALIGMVIAFAYLVKLPERASEYDGEARRLQAIEDVYQRRLGTLQMRLVLRRRADSVRRILGTRPSGEVRAIYATTLPVDVRLAAESLMSRVSRKAAGPSRFGTDIAVLHLPSNQGVPFLSYVLPTRPGDRCLVIMPLSVNDGRYRNLKRTMQRQSAADQVLGPCAFFKAFGSPGPKVREWLDRRGWAFAGDGSWTTDAGWGIDRERDPSGRMSYAAWYLPPSAVDCLSGAKSICESAVLDPLRYRGLVHDGNMLAQPFAQLGSQGNFGMTRLGFREGFLLAEMIRLFGREKFEKFWHSDAEMPVAFEQATGQRLGEWVSSWMVTQYGEIEKRPPLVSTYTATIAVLLVVLTAFIGIRIAAHRQFA
jgi:hypothetical protein